MSLSLTARVAGIAVLLLLLVPGRGLASNELFDLLGLPEVMEIMREEGIAYGDDLEAEMFPGRGGMGWDRVVASIYDSERMEAKFREAFAERLDDDVVDPLIAFFGSERGQEIVGFEISARRALLDEDMEEMARSLWQDLRGESDPRLKKIERFVEANNLIEANVEGAMNASLAFYDGLATTRAFRDVFTPDEILRTVWSQEAEIRADTREWIYPFLTLAFDPLTDDDIDAYIALSESDAGQALNAALFGAFDLLFIGISRDLGAAAALYSAGEDI